MSEWQVVPKTAGPPPVSEQPYFLKLRQYSNSFTISGALGRRLGPYCEVITESGGDYALRPRPKRTVQSRSTIGRTLSVSALVKDYNLKPGDVLPVVERDGLFVIQRPVRDAEAHDRAGEVPA